MNALEKILFEIRNVKFEKMYNLLIKKGSIIKFDESFYSKFEGMYFNGLPIYYYLQELNMGNCYDISAILSLALRNNNYVCRGELHTMSKIYKEIFDHGWVEDELFMIQHGKLFVIERLTINCLTLKILESAKV